MNIAFFDTKEYDKTAFASYDGKDGLNFRFYEARLCDDTAELARGFDAICAFVNDDINSSVIEKICSFGVKLIALRCSGYNNVDMHTACGKIAVARVPAYSPYTVAEHAMAMLLCSIRRIHKAYLRTKDFNFSLNGLTGTELHGKTVGIIGAGRIGKAFADICRGFGMKVIAYDKFAKDCEFKIVRLDDIFCESDIISLHCPLNAETFHIICKESISKMKNGVILINTSRGALIDSEALLSGIKQRKIGGACLDVYEEESEIFFEDRSGHIMSDDTLARLISMPNVLVTSHQAFLTKEALEAIAKITVGNIRDYFECGCCENSIC